MTRTKALPSKEDDENISSSSEIERESTANQTETGTGSDANYIDASASSIQRSDNDLKEGTSLDDGKLKPAAVSKPSQSIRQSGSNSEINMENPRKKPPTTTPGAVASDNMERALREKEERKYDIALQEGKGSPKSASTTPRRPGAVASNNMDTALREKEEMEYELAAQRRKANTKPASTTPQRPGAVASNNMDTALREKEEIEYELASKRNETNSKVANSKIAKRSFPLTSGRSGNPLTSPISNRGRPLPRPGAILSTNLMQKRKRRDYKKAASSSRDSRINSNYFSDETSPEQNDSEILSREEPKAADEDGQVVLVEEGILTPLESQANSSNSELFHDEIAQHNAGDSLVAPMDDDEEEEGNQTANPNIDRSEFLVEATLVDDAEGNNMTEEERAQLENETRKRVIHEMMVDAEAAVVVEDFYDPIKARRRRRQNICICLAFSMVTLAVILGSVLGTASTRKSSGSTLVIVTPAPTISTAPTVNPSPQPTISPRPSNIPSVSPSALPSISPTSSPRPSQQPSTPPSQQPSNAPSETPDNNYCYEALDIFIGDQVFIEDLFSMALDAPTWVPQEDSLYPGWVPTFIPSQGNGTTPIPQPLQVVMPSQANGDAPALQPSLGATTEHEGTWVPSLQRGEETWVPSIPQEGAATRISTKEEALDPNPPQVMGSPFQNHKKLRSENIFSSQNRQSDFDSGVILQSIIDCKSGMAYSAPGRWYRLQEGVGPVTVTTCDMATTANTAIHVYTDTENCPGMMGRCAPGLTYKSTENGCTEVSFISQAGIAGAEYLLLVTEKPESDMMGGSVLVTILKNDLCSNSYGPLPIKGDSFFGSISGAAVDSDVPACGKATAPAQPGVWFHVVGTGGFLQLETCAGTIIDTQISVFRSDNGTCLNLDCVDGNDNACGSQSAVAFESELGVTYYVLVHGGSATSDGSFNLKVEEISESLPHDLCEGAQPIELFSGEQVDITVPLQLASVDPELYGSFCVYAYVLPPKGFWYFLTGTGGNITVSNENPYSSASLALLQGDCDNLTCNGLNFFIESSFLSVKGERYLLFVYYVREDDASEGNVVLHITASVAAE